MAFWAWLQRPSWPWFWAWLQSASLGKTWRRSSRTPASHRAPSSRASATTSWRSYGPRSACRRPARTPRGRSGRRSRRSPRRSRAKTFPRRSSGSWTSGSATSCTSASCSARRSPPTRSVRHAQRRPRAGPAGASSSSPTSRSETRPSSTSAWSPGGSTSASARSRSQIFEGGRSAMRSGFSRARSLPRASTNTSSWSASSTTWPGAAWTSEVSRSRTRMLCRTSTTPPTARGRRVSRCWRRATTRPTTRGGRRMSSSSWRTRQWPEVFTSTAPRRVGRTKRRLRRRDRSTTSSWRMPSNLRIPRLLAGTSKVPRSVVSRPKTPIRRMKKTWMSPRPNGTIARSRSCPRRRTS
mmetsp:Transcript_121396/g.388165  ORF Transcript_121396/g.388165 Transcript_121396/m.388165 type:complete len:353 (-) Transcript_121396:2446-3504(-)